MIIKFQGYSRGLRRHGDILAPALELFVVRFLGVPIHYQEMKLPKLQSKGLCAKYTHPVPEGRIAVKI